MSPTNSQRLRALEEGARVLSGFYDSLAAGWHAHVVSFDIVGLDPVAVVTPELGEHLCRRWPKAEVTVGARYMHLDAHGITVMWDRIDHFAEAP